MNRSFAEPFGRTGFDGLGAAIGSSLTDCFVTGLSSAKFFITNQIHKNYPKIWIFDKNSHLSILRWSPASWYDLHLSDPGVCLGVSGLLVFKVHSFASLTISLLGFTYRFIIHLNFFLFQKANKFFFDNFLWFLVFLFVQPDIWNRDHDLSSALFRFNALKTISWPPFRD